MELLVGPMQDERLIMEEYATEIGFEAWASENVTNILQLCANDQKQTLAYAWYELAKRAKDLHLCRKLEHVTSWMLTATVYIMLNRIWRRYPKQFKRNIKHHMKEIYPIDNRSKQPFNLDYIFKNFYDPWKMKYFENLFKLRKFTGVNPTDLKLIKKEGLALIILRAIKIAERGWLEVSMHLLLKLLCIYNGTFGDCAVKRFLRRTPRADRYSDCARYLLQTVISCSLSLESQYGEFATNIVKMGIQDTHRDYHDAYRSILLYSSSLNLENKIGKMVYGYIEKVLRSELELLFNENSEEIGFVNDRFGNLMIDIFIGHMECTKRFGTRAAQMAIGFLQKAKNFQSLDNLYVKLNDRKLQQWRKTKETVIFMVLTRKILAISPYQENRHALLNHRLIVEHLLRLREELSHVYGNFADVVKKTIIKRELRFTAFCLCPSKDTMQALVRLKPRQLYSAEEYYSQLNAELDNYQQPIPLPADLRDILNFCRIPNLSLLTDWTTFKQELRIYLTDRMEALRRFFPIVPPDEADN